jgi:hypothetical protein
MSSVLASSSHPRTLLTTDGASERANRVGRRDGLNSPRLSFKAYQLSIMTSSPILDVASSIVIAR